MSILFDILMVFGFTLLMLAVSFIRVQAKAGFYEPLLKTQTTEELPLDNGDIYGRRQ
ncbi:hypothetical protein [Pseudochrobactrum kiredjianiae]|uniref:Cbb3-type cytochrome c oxidase subunit 3 n=1 Tax=Pseudochrobactrum kiredjianiae TaxID=386305 RepID=A0ABW3V979_9HYPH|nr:hypothetical protein [Pseudochrobactrum kiredjianiae]MDM7849876.1 hypothetical protein [Pseudochrobactrum kiredjianiae]